MVVDSIKINEELSKAGIVVNDVYDLVNTKAPYPKAIPILINSLREGISERKIKEGVIRALGVKEAKGIAGPVLLTEFYNTPNDDQIARWVIGNAMTVVVTRDEVDEVLEIVKDKTNGMSRQMFVYALSGFRSDEIEDTIIQLLSDDDVVIHALKVLRRWKSKKAMEEIIKLLDHPKPVVRSLAKDVLKKIRSS